MTEETSVSGSPARAYSVVALILLLLMVAVGTVLAFRPKASAKTPLYKARVVSAKWVRSEPGKPDNYLVRIRLQRRDGAPFVQPWPKVDLQVPGSGAFHYDGAPYQMHPSPSNCQAFDQYFIYKHSSSFPLTGLTLLGEVVEFEYWPLWKKLLEGDPAGKTEIARYGVEGGAFVVPAPPPLAGRPTFDSMFRSVP